MADPPLWGDTGFGGGGQASIYGGDAGDWGFGSPGPPVEWDLEVDGADHGFGSVIDQVSSGLILVVPVALGATVAVPVVMDVGGDLVGILADWPPGDGPFRVLFRNAANVTFPVEGGYALAVSLDDSLAVAEGGDSLVRVVAPSMPPGNYTLVVQWGALWQNQLELDGLRVIRRNRAPATYRIRGNLHDTSNAGPREPGSESRLTGGVPNG